MIQHIKKTTINDNAIIIHNRLTDEKYLCEGDDKAKLNRDCYELIGQQIDINKRICHRLIESGLYTYTDLSHMSIDSIREAINKL